jgi:hypothetical protein
MEWDFGTLPMIERSKTNSCTKIIYNSINIVIEQKTKVQYIHGIMNPYTKTNFGNTHIELLNLPSLKMFTYAILGFYLKPTMSKNPM